MVESINYRIGPASSYCGISAQMLRKLHRQGKGPERMRVGKLILYARPALDKWLASRVEVSSARSK